jgi:hypothetical protein
VIDIPAIIASNFLIIKAGIIPSQSCSTITHCCPMYLHSV